MENAIQLTNSILIIIIVMSSFTTIISIYLAIYNIFLTKQLNQLKQILFSLHRSTEQKETILENTVSRIAEGVPLSKNPAEQEKLLLKKVEDLIHNFSAKLNRIIYDILKDERNIWNDKFSVLLHSMGKNVFDLKHSRDIIFKDSWTSITELRQKSQLLFIDMKEDGIFYRIQTLWLLSDLCLQQKQYQIAYRHLIAALKLCLTSQPSLPITHTLTWKIATTLYTSAEYLTKKEQEELLYKFQLSSQEIVDYFHSLENSDPHIEIIQKLQIWNNQLSSI